ncbi:hypothetical protein [Baekduia sp. Peel2402]|uniref:hypothetical protein n=1 Tax=Baekduia sp. Peel2402 TaxID=3458296 RepID=UPI00403E4564
MLRRTLRILVLALVLAGFMASLAQAREAIRGPNYRTAAPSGWHVDKQTSGGWSVVTITPPTHTSNQRDKALVSIAVTSVKRAEKVAGVSIRDKKSMVQKLISVPQDAGGLDKSFDPRPTTLRHKQGVIYGVHYNYKGTGSTHTATLVRRGKRIYLIQVIKDEDLSELGTVAANMIVNDWRWK